ncbi:FecR family protein [Niastella populi]|uniref:Iron dicitrate transport regulator FecR n=1 Tax=Niastella populi TaxID=550983 RepID=A0A1V9EP69_9BACT|nr:FecR family protein [Niastella populi]OQP47881.1 hypothetical protein A4R26_31685 [Niastella populi]
MTSKDPILPKVIVKLLHKYVKGRLSRKESRQLENWAQQNENNPKLLEEIKNQKRFTSDLTAFDSFSWEDISQKLAVSGVPIIENTKVRPMVQRWHFMAAAALLIMAVAVYLLTEINRNVNENKPSEVIAKQNDIAPGKYKARLTLADGSTIILDSINTDSLTRQGTAKLANENGRLVYKAGKFEGGSIAVWNTLTTVKAETYQLLLSDGSKVWLNSGSSIRYPVHFVGNERKVEITGEAYFEVTHNSRQPFIVKANSMEVQVLGTTFNINAYPDEGAIKTTLVAGKVKVLNRAASTEQSAVLAPGQQAQLQSEKISVARQVNIDQAVAWRYGRFQFDRDDIKTVMRQIARWYDVEVSYEGEITNKEFWGKVSRDLNASEMLKVLEVYGVHFKIDGKRIIVTQ